MSAKPRPSDCDNLGLEKVCSIIDFILPLAFEGFGWCLVVLVDPKTICTESCESALLIGAKPVSYNTPIGHQIELAK